MKKFIVFAFILMRCLEPLHAQMIQKKLQVDISTGYQQENFHWSISGNISGQSPNVLSELKWTKIGGQNIAASASWNFYKRLVIYADYSRQFISSGTVNDADYSADNRSNATYNETFNANKGNTSLWSLGAGYIIFNSRRFSLTSILGYTESKESLRLLDRGNMFPNLNSSYSPCWKGGFLKLTPSVSIIKKLEFKVDITYQQVSYNSNGNWNLITSFQHPISYQHHANGYGIQTGGKLSYHITNNAAINLGGGYFTWQTGNGTDALYLSTGEIDKTQLNSVSRNGFQVYGGLSLMW
jgi:hypothetical protein